MFEQKAYIIGRVKSMGIKNVESEKNGKSYVILESKVALVPDNVHMTISKLLSKEKIEAGGKAGDFLSGKVAEFESIMAQFNSSKDRNEDFYITANIKGKQEGKGKDKKVIMYDALSSQDDGQNIWFQASGFVSVLPYQLDEENSDVIFNFSTKDIKRSELKPTAIEVTMAVADIDENRILLTSGNDFPTELHIQLPEGKENKAEVGQGYKFLLNFVKIAAEDVAEEDEDASWEQEAKPNFGKTVLEVKKVLGKVQGYTIDGILGDDDTFSSY